MAFRYAICSEIFKDWSLREACQLVQSLGYSGFEVAPFMWAESVDSISPQARTEFRRTIEGEGLVCSGLHWLLLTPKGLHLTTADAALRERSWSYLGRLIDFCGDLGGPVMILGSPYQRNARDGQSVEEALDRLAEGLARLAPRAAEREVTLLMEAVSSQETNVVTTLEEAVRVVDSVGHPNVQTMFDFHNAADQGGDFLSLPERYFQKIRHVHVNEVDGRHPGTGEIDFARVLQLMKDRGYEGWVSLEVFDFEAGPERIARESIDYLRSVEAGLA